MQQSNTSSPLHKHDLDSPLHTPIREPWENYIQFTSSANPISLPSPNSHYSEILYEKPQNSPEPMEEEQDDIVPYTEDTCLHDFIQEHDFSQSTSNLTNNANMRRQEIRGPLEEEGQAENERSECSRCHSEEEEEEVRSISTRESLFRDVSSVDGGDNMSSCGFDAFDENFSVGQIDQNWEEEVDLKRKAFEVIQDRPEEEKRYIDQVMPYLVCSMKEVQEKCQLPITNDIVSSIIKDLLYNRELMIGAERKLVGELVEKEMEEQRSVRPHGMVTEDDLVLKKRKEKKASKGNRNSSNLNHMNENYVSNIFQFARRNFPQDKEIQKIGNERNVSALNFRNLMTARLTDNVMMRKAKARMVNCGRELVGNIEYWMKDGYFDQCNDREKYILHKEKALRDLALSGQY